MKFFFIKNLLWILCLCFMLSCKNEEASAVRKYRYGGVETTVQAPKPKLVSNTPSLNSNAQQTEPITTSYPYNFNFLTPQNEIVKSNTVLKNNGKPTVLLFWLTTCPPCHIEMEMIKKKYAQWQKEADFNFYAISTDFPKNHAKFIKRVADKKYPWEAYLDVNKEFRKILPGGLNGLPQTFLLDKDGNIVYHKKKYRIGDEDTLFEKVKAYAAK